MPKNPNSQLENREKVMTLGEHLDELRSRIIKGLLILFGITILGLFYGSEIHKAFIQPYRNVLGQNATFYQIQLMAPFLVYLKTSFFLALLLCFPLLLYLVWGFIAPAFSESLERSGRYLILSSTLLFWAGIILCWFSVFESFLRIFLVTFIPEGVEARLPIDEYYDLFFNLHLVFGLSFQLPIVMILLASVGILKADFLKSKWRESIVGIAFFSAIFSPGPDVFSMLMLLFPLLILFLVSFFIIIRIEKTHETH